MAGSLIVALAGSLLGQDATFVLTTADPGYRTPGFIGNGAFSLVTSPLGTAPALSFAAGVYDAAPGDVARIAALPEWNAVDVWDGRQWLNRTVPDTTTLSAYRQTLDLYDGVLRTSYRWRDGDRDTEIRTEVFVSRADPHLAVIRLAATPEARRRVTFRVPLTPRAAPRRLALAQIQRADPRWTQADVWYPGHIVVAARGAVTRPAARLWLGGRTVGRGTGVAVAAAVGWPADQRPVSVRRVRGDSGIALEVSFEARPGVPVTAYKFVGIAWGTAGEIPLAAARAAAANAARRGYAAALEAHRTAWHRLWRTDVLLEGNPELQRVVHAMLFSLLASARKGTAGSIPPMGLSSGGYFGHVFWDADTWMFPALLLLHPDIARSMVAFRVRVLAAARRNAAQSGYQGAMYPWESDERGAEATPHFAWQNALYENHVTADVALAQWQYFLATGDTAWLADSGYPVLAATADFWVSRATYDSESAGYAIRHVVSVDEGMIGIGNDAYTNAAVRRNLAAAVAAARTLGRPADSMWARVAARLYLPYDSVEQYHPTYQGAPDTTRGSVVPLLAYPLRVPMPEPVKRNDLRAAVARVFRRGPGGMMTVTLYPVVAAELGERALVDSLLPISYRGYLRPPFDVLAETPRNQAVDFVTGAGGFLQEIVYGFTGLRWEERGLTRAFRPVLPSSVHRLTLRDVSVRGKRYDIVVEGDSVSMVPR